MAADADDHASGERWKPRPYQQPLWDYLAAGGKRSVMRAHRRAGKMMSFFTTQHAQPVLPSERTGTACRSTRRRRR